jgi:hypothetical protein
MRNYLTGQENTHLSDHGLNHLEWRFTREDIAVFLKRPLVWYPYQRTRCS